ncbi:Rrf2 family transcriptional regulator [Leptospira sp. 2 VSF19]|uniref:Rrf2 family transcriptional regulator n=1 Tax=Leptospira soteropolitanensis TaxID=2950025 RepID=A0AAW5VIB0_9LEPT|nr:Rrf2 family transcriptional regulator [Leptospira soteropolitanensis]MCW7491728.1 Rrf2 family transcriptional regulator [Leptospira soteropolitanensis]MCW7499313.1 Rrf2 family transcriptional regulator [Leptospira soteropolitanensis]MCW7521096.1 Rrf2 family transcriptional regulator [Leptospira soteropolitanensis]MCW7525416.1 Rrf2 family transcriptional regulator [Leptospira soteropolitanensis]MCW7529283.1 Rrf2 family transcriptional regulator [Leptospira soteropolitanensis]
MSIPSRYSVAIHILTILEMNGEASSEEIASSVGTNPAIIRLLLGKLKKAGIIYARRGIKGSTLSKPAREINLLDIYKATENEDALFLLHENPNPNCPIGKNIQNTLTGILEETQKAMEDKLSKYNLSDVSSEIRQRTEFKKKGLFKKQA